MVYGSKQSLEHVSGYVCTTVNFILVPFVAFQRRGGDLMRPELKWVGVFENHQDLVHAFWGEKTRNEGA